MNILRKIRRDKEISQDEIGHKIGIDQAIISRIERGYFNPSKEMKEKIADFFDCSTNEIFPLDKEELKETCSPLIIELLTGLEVWKNYIISDKCWTKRDEEMYHQIKQKIIG